MNLIKKKLWKAKQLVDSTFHSDTGEKIFLPFRMSSFVPTNLVIVAGMLLPNPSNVSILFWQWINQSVNVAFNYSNANKTVEMNMNETSSAYAMAVASSCSIALGLTEWLKRSTGLSANARNLLGRTVPFAAVGTAGVLNVFLMRQIELKEGIDVQDEAGHTLGKSQAAGWTAVKQVSISRVATSFPAVFVPGMVMNQIEKTSLFKKWPKLKMPINLATISLSLLIGLPAAVAIFPQQAVLPVEKLEPRFQRMVDSNGNPIRHVYFNRGL